MIKNKRITTINMGNRIIEIYLDNPKDTKEFINNSRMKNNR